MIEKCNESALALQNFNGTKINNKKLPKSWTTFVFTYSKLVVSSPVHGVSTLLHTLKRPSEILSKSGIELGGPKWRKDTQCTSEKK